MESNRIGSACHFLHAATSTSSLSTDSVAQRSYATVSNSHREPARQVNWQYGNHGVSDNTANRRNSEGSVMATGSFSTERYSYHSPSFFTSHTLLLSISKQNIFFISQSIRSNLIARYHLTDEKVLIYNRKIKILFRTTLRGGIHPLLSTTDRDEIKHLALRAAFWTFGPTNNASRQCSFMVLTQGGHALAG